MLKNTRYQRLDNITADYITWEEKFNVPLVWRYWDRMINAKVTSKGISHLDQIKSIPVTVCLQAPFIFRQSCPRDAENIDEIREIEITMQEEGQEDK